MRFKTASDNCKPLHEFHHITSQCAAIIDLYLYLSAIVTLPVIGLRLNLRTDAVVTDSAKCRSVTSQIFSGRSPYHVGDVSLPGLIEHRQKPIELVAWTPRRRGSGKNSTVAKKRVLLVVQFVFELQVDESFGVQLINQRRSSRINVIQQEIVMLPDQCLESRVSTAGPALCNGYNWRLNYAWTRIKTILSTAVGRGRPDWHISKRVRWREVCPKFWKSLIRANDNDKYGEPTRPIWPSANQRQLSSAGKRQPCSLHHHHILFAISRIVIIHVRPCQIRQLAIGCQKSWSSPMLASYDSLYNYLQAAKQYGFKVTSMCTNTK